jgi:hypothetical protein
MLSALSIQLNYIKEAISFPLAFCTLGVKAPLSPTPCKSPFALFYPCDTIQIIKERSQDWRRTG